MKATDWRVEVQDLIRRRPASLLLGITFMLVSASTFADGCFVFRWNKQKDINEPTQKAIILHDQNREDLILQVKYEGSAEDFGWIIPVPAKPEVRKGSMEPFYELSRLTQRQFHEDRNGAFAASSKGGRDDDEVNVIEVKTVGAYEVAVLSSTDSAALAKWLTAHQFSFPKEKQDVLDQYVQKHWFFVAARINPNGNGFVVKSAGDKLDKISADTRKKLGSGELHPIMISFPSEKCVFPLAISAVNGTPSEISLYVLSADPLLSSAMFDRKMKVYEDAKEKWISSKGEREQARRRFQTNRMNMIRGSPMLARLKEEDPNDLPPDSTFERPDGESERQVLEDPEQDFYSRKLQPVWSMSVEGDADDLKGCRHDLPRIKGRPWWLTKMVDTFRPEEMVDLEFEEAIPFLAQRISRENGEAAAHCLYQYKELAVPAVLTAINDSNAAVRKRALLAAGEMIDTRFVEPVVKLMEDTDADVRRYACYAAGANWDRRFADPMLRLIRDPNPAVVHVAQYCLRMHLAEVNVNSATLRTMLAEDGPASLIALNILQTRHEVSHEELVAVFSSTNLPTLSSAFTPIRYQLKVEEVSPLMTNSLPIARQMALGVLARIGDKPAVDRITSMLQDPNEAVRWRARSTFRRLTGQKLGADPAAYEKWWAENRETYVPRPQTIGSR